MNRFAAVRAFTACLLLTVASALALPAWAGRIAWPDLAATPATMVRKAAPALTVNAPGGVVEVVEYYNAALDHYFISADPAEIAVLSTAAPSAARGSAPAARSRLGRRGTAGRYRAGVPLLRNRSLSARRVAHRAEQPFLHGGSERVRIREDRLAIDCHRWPFVSGVDVRNQRVRRQAARWRRVSRRHATALPHVQQRRARRSQPSLFDAGEPAAVDGGLGVRGSRHVPAAGRRRDAAAAARRVRRGRSPWIVD